jgi:thymidylate kinase
MNYIFEGPDCSGKSTAIEKFGKYIKRGLIIKNLYKPSSSDDDYIYTQYRKMFEVMKSYNDVIIFDRFFPSQAIYSYLRGKDEYYNSLLLQMEDYAITMGMIYVYIDTPLDVLIQRLHERGDEHISEDKLITLKDRYDRFFNETRMRKIKIDTRTEDWIKKLGDLKNEY